MSKWKVTLTFPLVAILYVLALGCALVFSFVAWAGETLGNWIRE